MLKIAEHQVFLNKKRVAKAFTLLESLLVLTLVTGLLLSLSGQVKPVFNQVRQELFFLEFEHLYKESQQLSQAKGQKIALSVTADNISNGVQTIVIPDEVVATKQTITFDTDGGNQSLSKIAFQAGKKQISYQLYLGSGKYKKTIH